MLPSCPPTARVDTDLRRLDIDELLIPLAPRTQSLRGFDPEFVDIVDYIVRITYRIWEQKQPGLVFDYYSEDCMLHTLAGPIRGAEQVVRNTATTMHAFPDRVLYADAVLWSGNDTDGYHSSHRITSQLTHLGANEFGPPTGIRARVTTIAHCVMRENCIVEEWLVRDNLALALQLGVDVHALARQQAARDDADPASPCRAWHEAEFRRVRAAPCAATTHSDARVDASSFACSLFDTLWHGRVVGRIDRFYHAACAAHLPSGRELLGTEEISGFVLSILASLPDARIAVDHVCCNPAEGEALDIAVRWTLAGTHTGQGVYGMPGGNQVVILAETHWHLLEGRIAEEWTVFDELAVLRQIYRGQSV